MKLLLLCTALFAAAMAQAAEGDRPNIVFILADDLGWYDLGCYGRSEHRTPALDQLAAQGMRFTAACVAQLICSPSRAALLTGLAPARLHLTTYLPGRNDAISQKLLHPVINQHLRLEEKTLAEYLREAGYSTACIGKWHLGGKGFLPTDQGFDLYQPGEANTRPSVTEGGKGEYDLTQRAMEFIDKNRPRPFFLYLAHNNPHIPYTAKTNLVERNQGAFEPVYAAVIETLDESVSLILKKLDQAGLRERTLVVFTSDNGGLHLPEGGHRRITHNGPLRAGKGYLYEGGLRVPLIVRWPGKIPAGRVVDTPVINTDWLPTLLEAAQIRTSERFDGTSILPLLTGQNSPAERKLFWHFPHYTNQGGEPAGAIRDGDWKLIEYYGSDRLELYHLASDLSEKRNLLEDHRERASRMQQELAAWRSALNAQTNRPNPKFEPARYQKIYGDFDSGRFEPQHATAADWERAAIWRTEMDAVLRDSR